MVNPHYDGEPVPQEEMLLWNTAIAQFGLDDYQQDIGILFSPLLLVIVTYIVSKDAKSRPK